LEGRRGLISQSQVGLNCHSRNKVKTLAAMGGSNSALGPAISTNNHANYGNKTTKQTRQHLSAEWVVPNFHEDCVGRRITLRQIVTSLVTRRSKSDVGVKRARKVASFR
jgi:hypothetical protein